MPSSLVLLLIFGLILMTTPVKAVENYALYSQIMAELPEEHIRDIGKPNVFKAGVNDRGNKFYRYEWDNLAITINLMPESEIPNHLNGFAGYVEYLSEQKSIPLDNSLIERIFETRMVLAFIVDPELDNQGRAEEVLGAITFNTKSLMFHSDAIYDENAKLVIGP